MDILIKQIDTSIPVHQVNHLDRIDPKRAKEAADAWRYLVALKNTEIIWILKWSYFQDHIPYCENLQVSGAWQQQWIWKKLMTYWHECMDSDWFEHTLISTNPSNSIIERYKKLGYIEIGSLDLRSVLDWEDEVEVFLVRDYNGLWSLPNNLHGF